MSHTVLCRATCSTVALDKCVRFWFDDCAFRKNPPVWSNSVDDRETQDMYANLAHPDDPCDGVNPGEYERLRRRAFSAAAQGSGVKRTAHPHTRVQPGDARRYDDALRRSAGEGGRGTVLGHLVSHLPRRDALRAEGS
jgi:hypothetical protein